MIKISRTYSQSYSFTDDNGRYVEGVVNYALLVPDRGRVQIVKVVTPLLDDIILDSLKDIVYDYKGRVVPNFLSL